MMFTSAAFLASETLFTKAAMSPGSPSQASV
jgi:hypothetical protein